MKIAHSFAAHKRLISKRVSRYNYKTVIENYLDNELPYLDGGFSMLKMSVETGINIPALSGFINREYGMNFNDFINKYRVDYFKNLVEKPEFRKWTLEAISYKSGFNSRTTFIRSFTKFCECSPSEYLKCVKTKLMVA